LNLTNLSGVTAHGAPAMAGRTEGLVKWMQIKATEENLCSESLKADSVMTVVNVVKWSYSYNKTNEMHQFLKSVFGIEICLFRTGFLSINRSLVPLASGIRIPLASSQLTCMTYI
jgi:hypothetical protein